MRKLLGTDGIRGIAKKYPLTIDICLKLSKAFSFATFSSLGIDTHIIGICPTPSISILTNYMKADCGIMISTSHNHFSDNGIKINRCGRRRTLGNYGRS